MKLQSDTTDHNFQPNQDLTTNSLNVDKVFTSHANTPFLLVVENELVTKNVEAGSLSPDQNRSIFQTWLVCVYCSEKTTDRITLLNHIMQQHPNIDAESDFNAINVDAVMAKSGIMEGKSENIKYTETLMKLGEYNKLFSAEPSLLMSSPDKTTSPLTKKRKRKRTNNVNVKVSHGN